MDEKPPNDRPRCACGCGQFLTAKQTRYASRECALAGFVERKEAQRRKDQQTLYGRRSRLRENA